MADQDPKFALNKECNYGFSPMPASCYVEYITDCNGGFSPMPSYCTAAQSPPLTHGVPEPMTWTMFGAGLILMLWVMHMRGVRS